MEKVNHPNHYNLPGRKECIEEMLEQYGRRITAIFCLTNAYKYIYRAGSKDETTEEVDIEKAVWYFNFVNNRLFSSITGSPAIKLYNDIKAVFKKRGIEYDKG